MKSISSKYKSLGVEHFETLNSPMIAMRMFISLKLNENHDSVTIFSIEIARPLNQHLLYCINLRCFQNRIGFGFNGVVKV